MTTASTPHQLALEGFEALPPPPREPARTDSVFFAVFPPPAVATRAAALALDLQSTLGLGGRPIKRSRLHVTLHPVGAYAGVPETVLAAATAAASTLVHAPFEVAFDHVLSFGGSRRRPLVLGGRDGVAALAAFQKQLGAALKAAGLGGFVGHTFTPHMTLLHDEQTVDERGVEVIRWRVAEFVLVHSRAGQMVPVVLGRWPLRGPGATLGPGEAGHSASAGPAVRAADA